MIRKLFYASLWIGLILYAFLLAPPDRPDTWELIQKLSTGQWAGLNPLVIALFNLMGILPMIYACFLLIDGRGQSIKAFPFVLGSFAVGAFAILPYLALREANPKFIGEKDRLLTLLDSPWTGRLLAIATIAIAAAGIYGGNWSDFLAQWLTSRFIHVMSLDFLVLSFLFPTLIVDDMAHRVVKNPKIFEVLGFIPLLGALIYLSFRPPILAEGTVPSEVAKPLSPVS